MRVTPGWTMLCLDASFLFNVVVRRLEDEHAALWERWLDEGQQMIAPRLIHYEIVNIFHKGRRNGTIDEPVAQRGLRLIVALPIRLVDDAMPFEAFGLAGELRMPASYDAHYVAVANRHGADLWTSDRRLWEKAEPRYDWVHYAPERLPGT